MLKPFRTLVEEHTNLDDIKKELEELDVKSLHNMHYFDVFGFVYEANVHRARLTQLSTQRKSTEVAIRLEASILYIERITQLFRDAYTVIPTQILDECNEELNVQKMLDDSIYHIGIHNGIEFAMSKVEQRKPTYKIPQPVEPSQHIN